MAQEIERKYIVRNDSYKLMSQASKQIVQAYLSISPDATVRLRIIDSTAYLTVKSRTRGCRRGEWEYEIPADDAREMIRECNLSDIIEKTRHYVDFDGHLWEIDEFHGRLSGLVIAEIELKSVEEQFSLPPFVNEEVTDDKRYYNSMLSKLTYPF